MAIPRPTLDELRERMLSDVDAKLEGPSARLPRSALNVLTLTMAGAIHELYGHAAGVPDDVLPDTATGDALDRIGRLYQVARIQPALASAVFIFEGQVGAEIPLGTRFRRDSDGLEWETTEAGTIQGTGQQLIDGAPLEPGEIDDGGLLDTYTLVSPQAGIAAQIQQAAAMASVGVDLESDDAYRARILKRIRRPAQGGNLTDYELWALEIAGITRAYPDPPTPGSNDVAVYVLNDANDPPTPGAGLIAQVQAHIDALRPEGAVVTVAAPTMVAMDPTIALTPDTTEVRAAVEAELRALLERESEPGATILLSHVREAISLAQGEVDHDLTAAWGGAPADRVLAADEVGYLGTVTWA